MSSSSESSAPPNFPTAKPAPAEGRFRFSKVFGRWWWLATIFIAAITYVVAMIPTWMDMDGPLYESTALIEVKPIVDAGTLATPSTAHSTSSFMNTQFEIIVSQTTLELALDKHNLLQRLGGDKVAAMKRMKKSIRTNQRRGTDLMELSYRDEDAELAHAGAKAIYEAFKDRRYELEMSVRKDMLKAIKIELQNKNDRVAELRKRLMDMAEKVGVIYVEGEDGVRFPGANLRDLAEKELYEAERELEQTSFQIKQLQALEGDDLLSVVAELPDAGFKAAYRKYEEAIKELGKMKTSGLAERHPDIQIRRARVLELKKSLEKRASNIQVSLKHRLALMEGRIKKMKEVVAGSNDRAMEKARAMQQFNVARKEYQTAGNIRDQMEIKYDIEKTKMVMPPMNIIVHETPEQAGVPVTRGREFFVTLGTVCSLPFSIGLGILLMYIAELIFPRRG